MKNCFVLILVFSLSGCRQSGKTIIQIAGRNILVKALERKIGDYDFLNFEKPMTRKYFDNTIQVECKWKQIQILFIPVWNYKIHCTVHENRLPKTEFNSLIISSPRLMHVSFQEHDFSSPTNPMLNPPLGFWNRWSGKLIILVFILTGVFSKPQAEENKQSGGS